MTPWARAAGLAALGWAGVACVGALPEPTAADAVRTGTALERLAHGRTLYVDKCSGCHRVIEPERFTDGQWVSRLGEMAERAHLRPEDRATVLGYLAAFSRRP